MRYRIAEFAKLGGVTVRTLQYYDRIGLLTPAAVTDAGHRYYDRHDLLRLQQILTLKWMGFSLEQIKQILDSPDYNLRESLTIQKAAINEQIQNLAQAAAAIQHALDALEHITDAEPDAATIRGIIQGISPHTLDDWLERYFSPDAQAEIARHDATPQELDAGQQAWMSLMAAFEDLRDYPPASREIQELAAQMHALVLAFTKGNSDVEAGIVKLHEAAQAGEIAPELLPYTPMGLVDADVGELMQQALTIYRDHHNL